MREVLFFRNFRRFEAVAGRFSGGHLKVWDYFNHVLHSPNYVPRICFSKQSRWDEIDLWRGFERYIVDSGALPRVDILFLAGMDWRNLTEKQRETSPIPIINLVQHVRHAWPQDPRYTFLKHRAVRICPSEQVCEALKATGRVRGPIFVIPYGIRVDRLPKPIPFLGKDLDFLIVANKRPALGRLIRLLLWRPRTQVHLLTKWILRSEFLGLLNRAKISVFLPNPVEGFYLPALEGMALGTIVVCPDCVGNRSFCLPDWNCLRPDYTIPSIRAATEVGRRLLSGEIDSLLTNARHTAFQHDLMTEREAFLDILDTVDKLWWSAR
jgi:hypothetical protein